MNSSRPNTPIPNILALFIALAGLVTIVFVGYSIAKSTTAQHWPTTTGTVLDSRVVTVDYSGGSPGTRPVQRTEVRYSYQVNGKTFESENLNYRVSQIGGEHRYYPPEAAVQYPVGASIRVSYNPVDPTNAVSDTARGNYVYLKLIGGILLLAAGAYYLATHRSETNLVYMRPQCPNSSGANT